MKNSFDRNKFSFFLHIFLLIHFRKESSILKIWEALLLLRVTLNKIEIVFIPQKRFRFFLYILKRNPCLILLNGVVCLLSILMRCFLHYNICGFLFYFFFEENIWNYFIKLDWFRQFHEKLTLCARTDGFFNFILKIYIIDWSVTTFAMI